MGHICSAAGRTIAARFLHLPTGHRVSCDNLILLCGTMAAVVVTTVQTSCSIIDLLMDMKSFFTKRARKIFATGYFPRIKLILTCPALARYGQSLAK